MRFLPLLKAVAILSAGKSDSTGFAAALRFHTNAIGPAG